MRILFILLAILLSLSAEDNGWTPLHHAIYDGNVTRIKELVKSDHDLIESPSKAGIAPLHIAVKLRQPDTVKLLVENGADVDVQDGNGQTPLHYAIAQNLRETAIYLIIHEADMDIMNNFGITPLHQAAYTGDTKLVQFMLDNGASVDLRNQNGHTACQMAFAKRNLGVSSLLLLYTKFPCGSEEKESK